MKIDDLHITQCPSCGSAAIKKVKSDFRRRVGQKVIAVPKLERFECPDCGEVLFDHAAMRRMQDTYLPRKLAARKVSA